MTVGQILTEIMKVTGLKQAPLAKKLHVGQSTISKWIKGEHSPNKDQWDRVIKLIAKNTALAHLIEPAGGADAPGVDDDFRDDWHHLSTYHRDLLKQLAKQLRRDQEPEKPTG